MNVTRISEFKAVDEKHEELYDFLQSLKPYISSSEGCISYEVLRHDDDQTAFIAIEKWDSKESHINSVNNFPKDQMQAAMSLFGAPPKGNYYY